MLDNLIISLILMFVSGLTFVAYKHPDLYEDKFFNKLMFAALIVFLGSQTYDLAISNAFSTLREFIDKDSLEKATSAKEEMEVPMYVFVGASALYVYSFFLSWLAHHMKYSVKKDDESR